MCILPYVLSFGGVLANLPWNGGGISQIELLHHTVVVVLKCHNDNFICLKFKLYIKCLINEKGLPLLRN